MTVFNSIELSEYIANRCIEKGKPITNIKLQFILFHIQEVYLAFDIGNTDKHFEAWDIGPVIPDVYYRFCGYGVMPIADETTPNIELTQFETYIVESMIDQLIDLAPWDLTHKCCYQGSAWDLTKRKEIISNQLILDCYGARFNILWRKRALI